MTLLVIRRRFARRRYRAALRLLSGRVDTSPPLSDTPHAAASREWAISQLSRLFLMRRDFKIAACSRAMTLSC